MFPEEDEAFKLVYNVRWDAVLTKMMESSIDMRVKHWDKTRYKAPNLFYRCQQEQWPGLQGHANAERKTLDAEREHRAMNASAKDKAAEDSQLLRYPELPISAQAYSDAVDRLQ